MRDHQLFEKTELSNGICLYTYQDAFPISCMELQLPLGSGHAVSQNSLIPGSPHFLEHTQLIRSEKYPESYTLDRALGLRSGNSNAATHPKATTHWIDTPAGSQSAGVDFLVDRVLHPIFNEQDLAIERSVVINERNQNKFYPGRNRTSQYFFTEFINDVFYPVEQIFGSDEDLESITVEHLQKMHALLSHSDKIVALAVGADNFDYLKEYLAHIDTKPYSLQASIKPTCWKRKDYHIAYFDTVAQPRLEIAWIHERPEYTEYRAICFIINLLINTTQGPLYQEFREEKGWTYGLDATCMLREYSLISGISFPVNSVEHVDYIRNCIVERIKRATSDQELVENEIIRQLGNQVYMYQTAGSIISSASTDILTHGRIHSEAEYREAIEKMKDTAWRNWIVDTYFNERDMGSVCFMPELRTR